jgi:undecaprenyl diphosphate synthase
MIAKASLHVAIIMDGNGRWAARRGLPRIHGHAAGVEALRRTVEAAHAENIAVLTVFAFSADNWRRPKSEVNALMQLLGTYLRRDVSRLAEADVRLTVIGRRDRLDSRLCVAIEDAERATGAGARLWLRVAVDYSSREAILSAAGRGQADSPQTGFAAALGGGTEPSPDVDLLIRTGGERRLSDFLLWECAYAELRFVDLAWPDFGADALKDAMADFAMRERRFGALPELARPPHAA